MKRISKLFISVLCLMMICSCSKQVEIKQDDSPISLYVGLGNNQAYYESLRDLIKQELGYDIEFVYTNVIDTSSSVQLMFKNNDLPADIVATAAKTPLEYLRNSCVDLMTCSTIVDSFTYQKAKEFTTEDGSIYQVPFTSRLIGITYNKTLLEEMGYELPHNFQDMLALKKKCDEDGVVFSVTSMAATGHGFNYLFHLMGSEWISSLEGSSWLDGFLAGETDSAELKKHSEYFKKWVENGFFQNCHDLDWNSSKDYCEKRALFFFDLTSGLTNYEGPIVDDKGNEIGTVKDEYGSIPWLSEDGSNNCYTYYDNMYLAINAKLIGEQYSDKLKKCVDILELMTSNKAASLFTSKTFDGYVSTNDFKIDESRTYYLDKQLVETGYLQPWYYNSFNGDTIIATGEVVNNYIKDGSNSFDDIFTTLDEYQSKFLNKQTKVLATLEKDLTIKQTAILNGEASILTYDGDVDGCLVAYVDENHPLQPFSQYAIVNNKAYKGDFEENYIDTIIPAKGQKVFGVKLLGNEIKKLLDDGLTTDDYNYPYVLVGIEELVDNKQYTIVININSVSEQTYDNWLKDNKIIVDTNNEAITYKIKDGFYKYFETHNKINEVD